MYFAAVGAVRPGCSMTSSTCDNGVLISTLAASRTTMLLLVIFCSLPVIDLPVIVLSSSLHAGAVWRRISTTPRLRREFMDASFKWLGLIRGASKEASMSHYYLIRAVT